MDEVEAVYPLFTGKGFKTEVWISLRAQKLLSAEGPEFGKKLERYAKNGFGHYTGSDRPIRPEGGAYRIGETSTLFRLYGGFVGNHDGEFVILDAHKKRGTKLDKRGKERLNKVANILRDKRWKKVNEADGTDQ